jgi:hypothetical protein
MIIVGALLLLLLGYECFVPVPIPGYRRIGFGVVIAFIRTFIPDRYLHAVGIICFVVGGAGLIFGFLAEEKASLPRMSSTTESSGLTAWDTPAYYTEMLKNEKTHKPGSSREPDS